MYKIVKNLVDIDINNTTDPDVQNSQQPGRYWH